MRINGSYLIVSFDTQATEIRTAEDYSSDSEKN